MRNTPLAVRQFVLYCCIGGVGASLDFALFALLERVGWDPVLATAVSVSLGIVTNFVLNVLFNFKTRHRLVMRFLSFYAVGVFGILLSMATVFLLAIVGGMDPLLAKLISIPLVVVAQFALNKHVTFAKVPAPPVPEAPVPPAPAREVVTAER